MAGTERAGEIAAEFVRLKVISLSRLELHRSLRQPMKLLDFPPPGGHGPTLAE
jgi:hypothetical protein